MLNKISTLQSYDGGDQGFFNSFFWQLKSAAMFDPNSTESHHPKIQRLSTVYNFDIGIYYLSSRLLVKPKIIHYTLAFVKPWHWYVLQKRLCILFYRYGYPLFDLNWHWLANRIEMNLQHPSTDSIPISSYTLLQNLLVMLLLLAVYQMSYGLCSRSSIKTTYVLEKQLITAGLIFAGLTLALKLTPLQLLPHIGWSLFTFNFVSFWQAILLTYLYVKGSGYRLAVG